ncbi:hypothetical protein ICW40_05710 [Actinotalea ferrariae]|uniref:hypothetical protein n=1 Tax=Actinotalea ferrariae TaxID=1386098 RepID=UPI001C8B90D9|nr:hypothetical protein [Actinotalea ferrariae]MBX9244302.1 hypothetical protein [Actinotalea ferrariae]
MIAAPSVGQQVVLDVLGHHMTDWDVAALDDLNDSVCAAVHEAAHHVARAALYGQGGDISIHQVPTGSFPAFGGLSEPGLVPIEVDRADAATVSMMGGVAEGELVALMTYNGEDVRAAAALMGMDRDLDSIHPYAWAPAAEVAALALIRHHWLALLRLARAVLDAPAMRLTWDEAVAALGPGVVGAGDAPASTYDLAWDQLRNGQIERATAGRGWPDET